MQPRSWNTPFVIMLIIFGLTILFDLALLSTYRDLAIVMSAQMWFFILLWPVLILAEIILYWVLRKKIQERKLVWVHLLCSLFAFVILKFLTVAMSYMADYLGFRSLQQRNFINYVQIIGFWGGLLIGHTALIVALVRIFSVKEPQMPNDDDFLSEITV